MRIFTVLTVLGLSGLAMGKPGQLDRRFTPQLRTVAAPNSVTLDATGRAWVAGGFDRAGGQSVSDLLVIGAEGGVERQPVPGYLRNATEGFISFDASFQEDREVFPLIDGGCLIPGAGTDWWRADAAGNIAGRAFADVGADEKIALQFERDDQIFVIRRFSDGQQVVELRRSDDGSVDPSFIMSPELSGIPLDVEPATDGKLWVLVASPSTTSLIGLTPLGGLENHALFRLEASGELDAAFTRKDLLSFRSHELVAGADGSLRVVMGPDQSQIHLWPTPGYALHRIEWYDAAGDLLRRQDFRLNRSQPFAWAEDSEGRFLAPSPNGDLSAWFADGTIDVDFHSPGRVSSVVSLSDGKWLIDGGRRLLPNGDDDPTWLDPQLDRPAAIREMQQMPGGRMVVTGDFTTVGGEVVSGLVVMKANGTVDPRFILDFRIDQIRSIAVHGHSIYAITDPAVSFDESYSSNLVKLNRDGSIDEGFRTSPFFSGPTVGTPFASIYPFQSGLSLFGSSRIHATKGGKLLLDTISRGGDVTSRQVVRLNSDGSTDSGFAGWNAYHNWTELLPLKNGGVVIGDQWLGRDGLLIRDLAEEGTYLRPLCEWQGGVLFVESENGTEGRLRLWKGRSWSSQFRAPSVSTQDLLATRGEGGNLYVQARFSGSRLMLRRLLRTGRIDPSFRAPLFEYRSRRDGGWWQFGESGPENYAPTEDQTQSSIGVMRWLGKGGGLWVGGDFNSVDGEPRDGLARIRGGGSFSRRR